MADTKTSALPSATTPLTGTEVLPIVQSSTTVKVTNNDLRPKQIQSNATSGVLQVAGPGASATRVMTTPDANFTVARTDAANSFTGNQTLSTGNLIQGTASKGINFTANTGAAGMTSQLLNWYEEGTWTPTFSTDGTAFSTLTFTVQNGRYTRIGRTVFLEVNVRVNAVSGGTGNLYVSGLPFTSTATYNDCGISIGLAFAWTAASAPAAGGVQASSTKIALYKDLAGTTCTATSLAAGCYFRFGTIYVCA